MPEPRTVQSATIPAPEAGGPCLLVHGGAWDIPEREHEAHRDGLGRAVEHGRALLQAGASAVEVVAETVATMEAHGAFDAGRGAVLTRRGTVELDAGLMAGDTLGWGAVAVVGRLPHPIRAARRLLERSDGQVRLLVGEGAERFAEREGLGLVANDALISERERRRHARLRARQGYHTSHPFGREEREEAPQEPVEQTPRGTVGCVARDGAGRLAAATSTGGTPFRPAGRVGDTPLPGCGFYATPEAAASATGWGEAIATVLLCGRAVDGVAAGAEPETVVRARLEHLARRVGNREGEGAAAGLLLLARDGRGAWGFTTPRMARAGWRRGGEAWVEV